MSAAIGIQLAGIEFEAEYDGPKMTAARLACSDLAKLSTWAARLARENSLTTSKFVQRKRDGFWEVKLQ